MTDEHKIENLQASERPEELAPEEAEVAQGGMWSSDRMGSSYDMNDYLGDMHDLRYSLPMPFPAHD
jgi:hypothetical protein